MATISLDFLPKNTDTKQKNKYVDLAIDLDNNAINGNQLYNSNNLNDIKVNYDVDAVRNSIVNIFTTSPGEKVLSPQFGIDLTYFLFEPCTEATADIIADLILRELPRFEPRITVNKLDIEVLPDEQAYNVNMQLSIPSLNVTGLSLNGQINNNGYILI